MTHTPEQLAEWCFAELCALHEYAGSPAWKECIARHINLALAAQQDGVMEEIRTLRIDNARLRDRVALHEARRPPPRS